MAIQLSYTSAEIEERLGRMDLDDTLTLSDHAADAKAVGDALDDLRDDIADIGVATPVEIYVDGTSLVINTDVTNGNEVSY